jgi:iron complex transport system substrate-binding protein
MSHRTSIPLLLVAVIVGLFAASLAGRYRLTHGPGQGTPAPSGPPRRIVSMAPNLTEILFELGLGDRVVGVTRYCTHPPEAAERPKIGGQLDPNFEAVVSLRPDLIVMLREQAALEDSFATLRIPTLAVADNSLPEIFAAIQRIGAACGVQTRAEEIVGRMRRRVERIRQATANRSSPRVLIVIDRTQGTGHIEDAYIAGDDGYFDRLIHLAGGRNAYRGPSVAYPVVSPEGLIHLDPEVIIDFSATVGEEDQADERLADWQSLDRIAAVRAGRVYAVGGGGQLLPGPRTVDLLENLARCVHGPDVVPERPGH